MRANVEANRQMTIAARSLVTLGGLADMHSFESICFETSWLQVTCPGESFSLSLPSSLAVWRSSAFTEEVNACATERLAKCMMGFWTFAEEINGAPYECDPREAPRLPA